VIAGGGQRTLRLGKREWPPGSFGIMAVINRTPDSFYDRGATYEFGAALEAADRAVAAGAGILDVGGVKAGPGADVPVAEEIRRVAGLVAAIRDRHPEVVISVDTWRAPVGEAVAQAGADLLNDAWGGVDPKLAEVAAGHGLGLVCSHAGGLAPRTRPHRPSYGDLVGEVCGYVTAEAARAVAAGVRPDGIVIDPAHDFGKNTWHSLELTRATADLVATGWPVLVAPSNKDFVGETLGLGLAERAEGTLAVLAVCAWEGARLFRVHDVPGAAAALAAVTGLRDAAAPDAAQRGRGRPGAEQSNAAGRAEQRKAAGRDAALGGRGRPSAEQRGGRPPSGGQPPEGVRRDRTPRT
jgi:dihydropteroate synthase